MIQKREAGLSASLLAKFSSVGAATLLSRLLGFLREMLIAAFLGTGAVADAFFVAFRFPNMFRRLFAEGAFNSAFVPVLAEKIEREGAAQAARFASDAFAALATLLLLLSALAVIFMAPLVDWLVAPGFAHNPEKRAMAITFGRIMFPYLFFVSLMALLAGVLNTARRYFLASLAPVLLNIVAVTALAWAAGMGITAPAAVGEILSWAVLLAGFAQFLLLWLGVKRSGMAITLHLPRLTPDVRRLAILAVPGAIAGGIGQINLLIGQWIASGLGGANAVLAYADRLYQLPLGVIGIAIGVVLLPELGRAIEGGKNDAAIAMRRGSISFAALLTLPAAAALYAIPEPFIAILYERGAFSAADTARTASALRFFALGLPFFVMAKIVAPDFFARRDTKTPMYISIAAVAVNIVGSLLLFPVLAERGIAIATGLSGLVNAGLLLVIAAGRGWWQAGAGIYARVGVYTLLATIMGTGLHFAWLALHDMFLAGDTLLRVATALGMGLGGAVFYFAAASACGLFSLHGLATAMRRRK